MPEMSDREFKIRGTKYRPGSPAPMSGQYTMVTFAGGRRLQCTAVKGKRLPSGGAGTAGSVWRLTDATHRKKKVHA